jgi:hypothetical protein
VVFFPRDTSNDPPKLTKRQEAELKAKVQALTLWARGSHASGLCHPDGAASLARSYGVEESVALKILKAERVARGLERPDGWAGDW